MRRLLSPLRFLALSLLCTFVNLALAQSSECMRINNDDERFYCKAITSHDEIHCGSINDSDKRAMCRAVARRDKAHCMSINNDSTRAICRAQF